MNKARLWLVLILLIIFSALIKKIDNSNDRIFSASLFNFNSVDSSQALLSNPTTLVSPIDLNNGPSPTNQPCDASNQSYDECVKDVIAKRNATGAAINSPLQCLKRSQPEILVEIPDSITTTSFVGQTDLQICQKAFCGCADQTQAKPTPTPPPTNGACRTGFDCKAVNGAPVYCIEFVSGVRGQGSRFSCGSRIPKDKHGSDSCEDNTYTCTVLGS